MDGENTTLYRDNFHARSLDGRYHPSRAYVKGFHGSIAHTIPENVRICGENMYAEHSVSYDNLEHYFLGFNVWVDDYCYSWDATLNLFDLLGITSVPTIWRGRWERVPKIELDIATQEGYVVRVTRGFRMPEFQSVVAKYVRKNHVQTDQHWMSKPIIPNRLK